MNGENRDAEAEARWYSQRLLGIGAASVVATGALLGLLLPSTSQFDSPAILLVPWEAAVAFVLGWAFFRQPEAK